MLGDILNYNIIFILSSVDIGLICRLIWMCDNRLAIPRQLLYSVCKETRSPASYRGYGDEAQPNLATAAYANASSLIYKQYNNQSWYQQYIVHSVRTFDMVHIPLLHKPTTHIVLSGQTELLHWTICNTQHIIHGAGTHLDNSNINKQQSELIHYFYFTPRHIIDINAGPICHLAKIKCCIR